MEDFLAWCQSNWFSLFQTVGVMGSLWFTAAYFRQDSRAKQIANLLSISERHRTLWSEAHQRPDLHRIFQSNVDLAKQPATVPEEEFLNVVIVHFETGWQLAKSIEGREPKSLERDVGAFFKLPLPCAVWEKTKQFRKPKFVAFVERAVTGTASFKPEQRN